METTQPQAEQSMTPFFIVWAGQAFSLVGSSLVSFALIWYLTQQTGSATVLALASLMSLLPQVFLGPIAGALVDRWDRKTVMIVADASIAAATVGIAVLFALGHVQIWQIYLLMFVRALGGGFHFPAFQASTTLMVPEKHLSRIAGLNQMLQGISSIAAPPLGALLIAILPMPGILAIDVSTAAIAITALVLVHVPQPTRRAVAAGKATVKAVLNDFKQGALFVWGWTGLMLIGVLAALLNMVATPTFSLLPLLVTEHFQGGALQLAWLESAFGIGMIGGGLLLSTWGGFKKRIVTAMAGLAAMGIGITAIGFIPTGGILIAVGVMFVAAVMNTMVNGSFFASLQATVPPEMQGRVFTLVGSVASLLSLLGLAVAGPVADAIGIQPMYVITGVVTLALGIGALFVPAIMSFEEQGRAHSDAYTNGHAAETAGPVETVDGVEVEPATVA